MGCGVTRAVDSREEEALGSVDYPLMAWMRESSVRLNLGSAWSRVWIFSTAWRTVVWSLPPNARPTSAREACVRWRARYMATWRGKAMAFVRFLARISASLM